MSSSHASKLLLLLTSSLICLGCDDEPQAPTQAPTQVTRSLSSDDAPRARTRTVASASAASTEAAPTAPRSDSPTASPSTPSQRPSPGEQLEERTKAPGMSQILRDKELQSPLSIESSLEASQGQWIARWKVRNESDEPIYLVTQLPVVKGGKARPDAHRIYVRPQGETLHVTKRMWRVPRALSPMRIELPYLLRLEPGQVHQGAIRLPASIAATYPYRTSPERPRVLVNQVVLSFGYFGQDAGPQASDAPGLFALPYAALSKQAFVSSSPHPARLAVR